MTAGGYGYMRATDQDRENVRSILQDAHAQGRLDWQDFDARSTALMTAQTYDQLAALTADLPNRIPGSPPQVWQPAMPSTGTTNGMAVAALVCGIVQFCGFWLVGTIPAIILGHLARRQIRQTGEQGAGLATAGIILGWVGVGLSILFVILFIALAVTVSHNPAVINPPQPGP
jgi:Domain of unknown function (DUF4190)/Domain of unknown function (DUF1707)